MPTWWEPDGDVVAEPSAPLLDIEGMLWWLARELRAEQMFAWYRARRPRAFIVACPPGTN